MGLTKIVHPYWRLATMAMQTTPKTSCTQGLEGKPEETRTLLPALEWPGWAAEISDIDATPSGGLPSDDASWRRGRLLKGENQDGPEVKIVSLFRCWSRRIL